MIVVNKLETKLRSKSCLQLIHPSGPSVCEGLGSWSRAGASRSLPWESKAPVPTVVIISEDDSDSKNWRKVAKQIYQKVEVSHPGVSVELLRDDLDLPLRCFAVT